MRRNFLSTISLIFLLPILFQLSISIYPEQTRYHWKHESVGLVQNSVFYQNNVIVSTDANLIASLVAKSGNIAWKKVIPNNVAISRLDIFSTVVAALCEDGHLYVWNAHDGGFIWDVSLAEAQSGRESSLIQDLRIVTKDFTSSHIDIVVSIGNTVFGVRDGSITWTWLAPQSKELTGVVFQRESKQLFAVLLQNGEVSSTEISASLWSSDIKDLTAELRAPTGVQNKPLVSITRNGKYAIFLSQDSIQVLSLSSNPTSATKFSVQDIKNLELNSFSEFSLDSSVSLVDSFVLRSSSESLVIQIGEQSSLSLLKKVSSNDLIFSSVPFSSTTSLSYSKQIIIAHQQSQNTEIEMLPNNYRLVASDLTLVRGFLQEYHRKGGEIAYRLVAMSSSGQLIGFSVDSSQQLKLVWKSEQALAHATACRIVLNKSKQIGVSETDEDVHFTPLSLAENIKNFAESVKGVVDFTKNWGLSLYHTFDDKMGRVLTEGISVLKPPTDQKSKHQVSGISVVLTKGGQLFGLSLSDGSIKWKSSWFLNTKIGANGHIAKLFEARKPGLFSPRMVVLMTLEHEIQVIWFDPLNGELIRKESSKIDLLDSFLLPTTDTHFVHFLGVLDTSNKLHIFHPDGHQKSFVPEFYHFLVRDDQTIVGLYAKGGSEVTMNSHWSFVLPAGESIAAMAVRRPFMKTSSATRVTGSRTLLHKYLNPHLVAIATTKPRVADETESVSLYLMDSISGRILHQSVHPGCRGNVNIVIADNDVVMTLWNSDARQYELVSIELFEDRLADALLDVVFGTMRVPTGIYNHTHYSSFTRRLPEIISKQYFFAKPITSLAVTETGAGISSKQILVGLESNQIYALDRKFINPRQPEGTPTPEQQEEFLVPYNKVIPFNTMNIVTYNNTVPGLKLIVTEAGLFESESHMIAVGIDILFVPLAPSGAFDQLSDDFNRIALVLALLILFAGVLITAALARRKELQKKWK
eukprot:c7485_g1_i2.p1 GENE.c7485_g1_i2~~c7485_g1_i2.p1  ORF type:complete len:988 (+),score=440.05 c7485_g1_i2:35-2965(+)